MTELEMRILAFASANRPQHETYTEFGWRPATYWQHLNLLFEDPRAEKHDPINVRRLRRVRDERSAARASRRLAI